MSSPRLFIPVVLALCVCLSSCSSTEQAQKARPGTPEYFWNAAETAWEKGDFVTASANLDKLTTREGEYKQRAQVWQMAILAGMAKGDMDWADVLETGRKVSRSGEAAFRREIAAARSSASQAVMSYLELANQHLTAGVPDQPVIAFTAAPPAARPVEIKKLEKGILPPAAEMELIHKQLRAQAISEATKVFIAESGQLSKQMYLAAMANEMVQLCDLYSPKRLNESGRVRMITQVAGFAVENMTPCEKSKELRQKIAALQKPAK